MNTSNSVLTPVLRAVALGMSVVTVVLAILGLVPLGANLIMLGIGVFAISVDAIQRS